MKGLKLVATFFSLIFLLFVVPVHATSITFDFNIEFSGATPPASTAPWISATFDDSFGGSDTVRLTMAATNLVGTEFIHAWYFNFDPILDPTLLSFSQVGSGGSTPNSITLGVDAFQADGDGLYDILFYFPPPPGTFANKFSAGETVTYDITYVSAITASSFNYLSSPAGGAGPFLSAAHVQGIGASGNDSGWVAPGDGGGGGGGGGSPVPEPATMVLMGVGLMGLGLGIRKKTK